MTAEASEMSRTAKVFMTNRSQAVRLPKEYQYKALGGMEQLLLPPATDAELVDD